MSELHNNKTFVFLSRACVVLLLICLVFNLCVIPSFALSDFSPSLVQYTPSSYSDYSNMTEVYSYGAGVYASVANNAEPVYAFWSRYSSTYCIVFVSSAAFTAYYAYPTSDVINRLDFKNSTSYNDGTFFSCSSNYYSIGSYIEGNTLFPIYNSTEDGITAYLEWVANGGGSALPTGSSGDVVIPAGWVSYIQVSGGNMLLETTFPEYSNIIGTPAWNSRSTIQYGVSSLPVEGTVFSENLGTLINWAKSTQGKNILGQTKQAGYGVNNLEQSQNYIVIYNPANRQVSERGQGDISPTITAHFTELIEAKSYPLTQTFNIGTGETTSTSVSGFDNPLTTTPQGTTDNDGNPSTPNIGGSGADASYNDWSVTNYLQSIKETLDNFASNFMGLLQSPISHVRQLISAGSDYFQVIQGLYAWLPSPVQTTIESALIVSISIGVIGLLL